MNALLKWAGEAWAVTSGAGWRVAVSLVAALALARPAIGAARCPDGGFLVQGESPLVAGEQRTPPVDAVRLRGRTIAVDSGCAAKRGRVWTRHGGTRLRASWRRCGGLRRVRLRARIDHAGACDRMVGVLRARGVPAVPFEALRSRCGDGIVDAAGGEVCDGDVGCAVGGPTCSGRCRCELPPGGSATSTSTTTTTRTMTTVPPHLPHCGDGVREGAEVCDDPDTGGTICEELGYPEGGVLACMPTCGQFDTSGCRWCGDGRLEGPEECDGPDFGGPGLDGCMGPWPEHGGTLSCTVGNTLMTQYPVGCRISRASCWTCGNGRVDPGEMCDDANDVDGDGCSTTCQQECGDAIVQYNEACDDGNALAGDGCTDCGRDVVHPGGGGESWDECMIGWGFETPLVGWVQPAVAEEPDGITVTCHDGEAGCDQDALFGQCTFTSFYCLNEPARDLIEPPCGPSNVARLDLLAPTTVDAATSLAAFGDTLERIGRATGVVATPTALLLDPPVGVGSMCGALPAVVPAGESRVLAVRVTDSGDPARTDDDRITFTCQRQCGDGTVEAGEGCDDGNVTDGDGCSRFCDPERSYVGGGGEPWDECLLEWGFETPLASGMQAAVVESPDGVAVRCHDGEAGCDHDAIAGSCTFLAFYCMSNATLSIPPPCTASDVARIDLLPATTADGAALLAAFADTLTRVGNATNIASTETSLVAPTAVTVPDMCGALPVVVPAGESRVIAVRLTDGGQPPREDDDRIVFTCDLPE